MVIVSNPRLKLVTSKIFSVKLWDMIHDTNFCQRKHLWMLWGHGLGVVS